MGFAHRDSARRGPTTFRKWSGGREQELSNIRTYLVDRRMRLLTLTGAGGIGKTRLAVEAARELQANFADGAVIVDLAAYREPLFVVSAIASAIGTRHAGSRSLLDAVKRQLQRMRLLLVLDNFEQVLAAAPLVADLLANCASLTILITSRAPLRLSWECEFPVGPLRTPASDIGHEPEVLLTCPSVALLVERISSLGVSVDTRDTAQAAALAEICRRLDGIPLAIELAAARARLLPPIALLAHLDHPLDILTHGQRDHPTRHQTVTPDIRLEL